MVSERFCPVCHHLNEETAESCSSCGAVFEGISTQVVAVPEHLPASPEAAGFVNVALIPEGGLGIQVTGAAKPFYVAVEKELLLGRELNNPQEAFVDLSAFEAFNFGVSRRHALIRRTQYEFEVQDLGSRNGTWLNAQQLIPNKPYPFASGSQLRLGKLQLSLMYHVTDNVARKK